MSRLTRKQLDALETIRNTQVRCIVSKTRTSGAYHRQGSIHLYLAEFSLRTVSSLEERDLVQRGDVLPGPGDDATGYFVRITDAGRVALGDWAAGEVSR